MTTSTKSPQTQNCLIWATKLSADDLILYQKASTNNDRKIVQDNLNNLTSCEDKWGMKFHPDKCEFKTICIASPCPIAQSSINTMHLRGHFLTVTDKTKYKYIIWLYCYVNFNKSNWLSLWWEEMYLWHVEKNFSTFWMHQKDNPG